MTAQHGSRLLAPALVLAAALAQEPAPRGGRDELACNRGGAILLIDVDSGKESVLVANNSYDRPLAWLPAGDRLIYWNHDGGAWDLWTVAPATQTKLNLTRNARDSRSAVGSPDGRSIAFHRGGDGVWLMNDDGAKPRRLHEKGHRDAPPAWSPSGRRVAFTDLESAGQDRVAFVAHLVEIEDGKAKAARVLGQGEVAGFLDERRLVIAGGHEGASELLTIDVETGARRALTRSKARDGNAVLSADRTRIAWVESGDEARLMVMNADGSGQRALAPVANLFAPPSFSPDGRHVAYESGAERGKLSVYIVPTGGGEPRRLAEGSMPTYRPRP